MAGRPLDFVAIDFETANNDRASVCQVGLVQVRRGGIAKTDVWHVVPPTGAKSFSPRNTAIHGIDARTVANNGGITWGESLARIRQFCGAFPLVAHNAPFDKSVFVKATELLGLPVPELEWLDTLVLARREFPELPRHPLPIVATHIGIPEFRHHDAAADATAAARIVMHVADIRGYTGIDEIFPPKRISTPFRDGTVFTDPGYSRRKSELPLPSENADPQHPLFEQYVVLTGKFPNVTRAEAQNRIAERGGTVQNGVTRQTTILVLAERTSIPRSYDPFVGTGKERKAGEYRAKGQKIEFVDGLTFERWLTQKSLPRTKSALGSAETLGRSAPSRQIEQPAVSQSASRKWSSERGQILDRVPANGYLAPERSPADGWAERAAKESTGSPARTTEPAVEVKAAEPREKTRAAKKPRPPAEPRRVVKQRHLQKPRSTEAPQVPEEYQVLGKRPIISHRSAPEQQPSGMNRYDRPAGNGNATGRSYPRSPEQPRHYVARGGGLALLVVGWVLLAVGGLGVLLSLLPLIGGVAGGDGELVLGSVILLVLFVIIGGTGGVLVFAGSRVGLTRGKKAPGNLQ